MGRLVLLFVFLGSFCGVSQAERALSSEDLPELLAFSVGSNWSLGLRCQAGTGVNICSDEPTTIPDTQEQIEFALNDVQARLGKPSNAPLMHVWSISDAKVWTRLLRDMAIRHDGVAFQQADSIYLYSNSDGEGRYLGLFHEIIHYVFWVHELQAIPLWAEEGAAQYYAWNIAQRYARSKKRELHRDPQAIPPDSPFATSWKKVMAQKEYPEDGNHAREFYQCAEYAVGAILQRLRIDQHAYLWEEYNRRPGDLEFILSRHFGWTEKDWNSVEHAYQRWIQKSRQ